MSTIHVGKSRTIAVSRSDGTPLVALSVNSQSPTIVSVTVNGDGTVTRRGLAPGSAGVSYRDTNSVGIDETVTVPAPPAPNLVLGTDGPEV